MKLRAKTWPKYYDDIVSGKKKTEFRQVESIVLTVKCPHHPSRKPPSATDMQTLIECDECRGVNARQREFAVKRVEAVNENLKNFDKIASRKYQKTMELATARAPDVEWKWGLPFLVIDLGETLSVDGVPRKVA